VPEGELSARGELESVNPTREPGVVVAEFRLSEPEGRMSVELPSSLARYLAEGPWAITLSRERPEVGEDRIALRAVVYEIREKLLRASAHGFLVDVEFSKRVEFLNRLMPDDVIYISIGRVSG